MNEYCALFSQYLQNEKKSSENTRLSYLRDLQNYFAFLEGAQADVQSADRETVSAFIESLHEHDRSQTTVSRNLASVRCFYKFLISQGIRADDPTKGIKLSRLEKKLPQILSGEEINRLLAQPAVTTVKGCRDKAMLELLYATGIRVSELINLDIRDVNLRTGTLYCRSERASRNIPIYPSAVVAVSDYLYRARNIIAGPESGNALFVNLNGNRLTRQGFWKIIKEYADEAGISTEITPHTLRHSFALHLLENGASLKDIQTMLGHIDISSTQVYTQLMDNHVKEVYNNCHPRANSSK